MSNEKSTTTSSSNQIQDWVYVNIPLTWEQVGQLIQAIGKAPRVDQHLVYNNVTLDMTIQPALGSGILPHADALVCQI